MGSTSASGIASAAPMRGSAILRVITLAPLGLLLGATPIAGFELDVVNLRSAKGMLRICLTARPESFPECRDDPRAISRSVAATQTRVQFDGLTPGGYAVAIIHDENGNKKLDTLMGIPREGFGFSRNPTIHFGPPKFDAARFPVDGAAKPQQVKMRYLL